MLETYVCLDVHVLMYRILRLNALGVVDSINDNDLLVMRVIIKMMEMMMEMKTLMAMMMVILGQYIPDEKLAKV